MGYLFERFPAFTQTFCARELAELYRQGISPPVYSIRRPTEARPTNIPLENIPIYYLPDTNSLEFKIRTKLIPPRLKELWSGSGDLRDKGRFREAVYRTVGRWLKGVYPVSTGLVVSALARPEWLVELDVIAVVPDRPKP